MNSRLKYSEKNYLCKYDLSSKFFKELGLEIKDIYPMRKVFLLVTEEGNKILKKVNYSIERVDLISDCLEFVKRNYKNVITYKKFKDGLNYKIWNEDIYVVMDMLEGREASISNPVEINLCAENIALMHKASQGIRQYLIKKYNRDFLDRSLNEKFKEAYDSMINIKNIVDKYEHKNEFDEIFLKNIDNYLSDILDVEERLKNSKYDDLRNDGSTICLCHNDLAYHNFLTNKQEINIIDFDYMSIDLRIMDLADFILKSIKNSTFDMEKINLVINGYENVSRLMEEEKDILNILLSFPRDFYTIVKDYYYKRKDWDYEVFLNRFKSKMDNEIFRYDLLENYKRKNYV